MKLFVVLFSFLIMSQSYGRTSVRSISGPYKGWEDRYYRTCQKSTYLSPGFNYGRVSNDQIGNATYAGLIFGFRNSCHLMQTGIFIDAQEGTDGRATAAGVIFDQVLNLKVARFYPNKDSSKFPSIRYTMGLHFLIIGVDIGMKVVEKEEKEILPTVGFNIGI